MTYKKFLVNIFLFHTFLFHAEWCGSCINLKPLSSFLLIYPTIVEVITCLIQIENFKSPYCFLDGWLTKISILFFTKWGYHKGQINTLWYLNEKEIWCSDKTNKRQDIICVSRNQIHCVAKPRQTCPFVDRNTFVRNIKNQFWSCLHSEEFFKRQVSLIC